MKISKIITNLFESNVFVVEQNNHCLIIDCGAPLEEVKKVVGDSKVVGILLTHAHYDHSAFCLDYANEFNAKIYANKNSVKILSDRNSNYSEGEFAVQDFSEFEFIDGDKHLQLGEFDIFCLFTPGHSPCSECYIIENMLFAGDVLFENGIGRTDLIFSDKTDMISSLEKLSNTKFDFVLSGHGSESDFEFQEKNISIFKKFLSR